MVPVSAASLRASFGWLFPFLLGGTFIEALGLRRLSHHDGHGFPFLLGGTFIEAHTKVTTQGHILIDFPSFWEGLSLRRFVKAVGSGFVPLISLPFGRDFH